MKAEVSSSLEKLQDGVRAVTVFAQTIQIGNFDWTIALDTLFAATLTNESANFFALSSNFTRVFAQYYTLFNWLKGSIHLVLLVARYWSSHSSTREQKAEYGSWDKLWRKRSENCPINYSRKFTLRATFMEQKGGPCSPTHYQRHGNGQREYVRSVFFNLTKPFAFQNVF